MEPLQPQPPNLLPVTKPTVRLRETIHPANRELDPGSAAWAGLIAPLMGALGYAVEHAGQLDALLRAAGVPEGTVSGLLFSLGLLYAALTRTRNP